MLLLIVLLLTLFFGVLSLGTIHLEKLEVIVLWMLISNLLIDIYCAVGVNLGYITTSYKLEYLFSFVVVFAGLIPTFITWMLGIVLSLNESLRKYVYFIIGPLVLVIVEYLVDFAGIIEHNEMLLRYSLLFWFFILVTVYIFQRCFLFLLKGD